MSVLDPSFVDPSLDSRAVTFENLTGDRGAGGTAHGGRKGAPNRRIGAGERVVLADIDGPGVVRHIWMTFPPAPPEDMRAVWMEVFYDGASEPSISVPCLDFFGLPHGRPVAYASALTAAQEGRGFNAYFTMPFAEHLRVELTNSSTRTIPFYYQIDYTLQQSIPADAGYLHVAFRRENPTTLAKDFVITEDLEGPGRFLGCNIGVRVIDLCNWYGEGEVKVYHDGDTDLPTICGTGLEDYVGTAWGLDAHSAPYGGAPLVVEIPVDKRTHRLTCPSELVGFYRWHLPDPIMYGTDLTVTIQQIGAAFFAKGQEEEFAQYERTNPVAGEGWVREGNPMLLAWGIAERVDDFCATSYVYCRRPQPVPRLDLAGALADIGRRPWENPTAMEAIAAVTQPT